MKELEAVNNWIKDYLNLCEKLNTNQQEKMLLDSNSPYNVLKSYFESIKNAKPSEALEIFCRERTQGEFIDGFPTGNIYVGMTKEEFEVVEQALLKAQKFEANDLEPVLVENIELDLKYWKSILKEVKAWRIVKEKCLYNDNLNYVSVCIDYDMYKEKMSQKHDTKVVKIDWNDKFVLDCLKLLTQEEFELLKEVLE